MRQKSTLLHSMLALAATEHPDAFDDWIKRSGSQSPSHSKSNRTKRNKTKRAMRKKSKRANRRKK